jgi:uncharacterized OB-fold protein
MMDPQVVDFSTYKPRTPEVYGRKCSECGTIHYPAPMICGNCSNRRDPSGVQHSAWEKVPMGGKCKLLTWTRVFALPEGFNDRCLLFGIAEFENGLRASGRLSVEEPKIGMDLIAEIGLVREKIGKDVYGFLFKKAGKQEQ